MRARRKTAPESDVGRVGSNKNWPGRDHGERHRSAVSAVLRGLRQRGERRDAFVVSAKVQPLRVASARIAAAENHIVMPPRSRERTSRRAPTCAPPGSASRPACWGSRRPRRDQQEGVHQPRQTHVGSTTNSAIFKRDGRAVSPAPRTEGRPAPARCRCSNRRQASSFMITARAFKPEAVR